MTEKMSGFGRFSRADAQLLDKDLIHRGFIGLERHRARHRLFAGGWGEAEREVVLQKQSATVLPYDPWQDKVVLIEQFRLPALLAGLPPWQIEVVAGLVDQEGEAPAEVAKRETQEEAGLEITALEPVAALLSSPGLSSEVINHFIGRAEAGSTESLHGLVQEQEDIRAQSLPFATAWSWLEAGKITNAPAWICLTWLKLQRERLRTEWC
ncbi:MAG TPA: NUDIX domain-containing protein [Kiloniellales bacterium]|nr:NUDIX domain-containing protein [Kiloniellales bacterium]